MAAKVQFSLRMIFVVTAAVAVVFAEAVALPEWLANAVGLAVILLLPSAFVAQIVYARGAGRAFGIGALCAWLTGLATAQLGVTLVIVDGGRIDVCVFWLYTFVGGGLSALVRWLSRA